MNQGDISQIRFRGKDATECEDFIAAILKHAFSQGKQRDDQWMADLAATCMVNAALRWWVVLDEGVQGSWKRLQRAMLSRYRPMFYGGSGEEAERFIRTVCDQAIDEGKQKDNEWIVTYASSCMAGEALRWYTHLESDTQENWKKLQQAVLVQYPRGAPDGPPTLSLVPTPPQAAPAVPAPRKTYRGRIRISNSRCSTPHYLSKQLSYDRISHTSSLEDALEVECSSDSDVPQTLSVPDSQIPGYDMLGVKWSSTSTSIGILAICAVDSRSGSTVLTSFVGELLTQAWKLSPRESSGTNSTTLSSFSQDLLTKAWKPPSQGTHGDGPFTVSAMVGGEVLYPRWNVPNKWVWFAASSRDPSFAADMFFELV